MNIIIGVKSGQNDNPIITKTVCKAAILNSKNQLLLLRRSSTATVRPLGWDLVGGKWDGGGESFEYAVRREAKEEAGLKITDLQITKALPFLEGDGSYKISMAFYARTDTDKIELSHEHDMFTWIRPHELEVYELPLNWHAAAVAAFKIAGVIDDSPSQ